MKYKVRLARSASREIERLPKPVLKRVLRHLETVESWEIVPV